MNSEYHAWLRREDSPGQGECRGIGRSIARRLAQEGVTVAVNDIDEESTRETVAFIEDDDGTALAAPADVTDLEEMRAAVEAVVQTTGGLDVMLNTAGWDRIEWFLDQDPVFGTE